MEIELLRGYLQKTGKTAIAWLQELCQKDGCQVPRYDDKDVTPHKTAPPQFEVKVTLNFEGREYSASGVKCKKKAAKEEAAIQLLHKLDITPKDLHDMQVSNGKLPFRGVSQNEDDITNGKADLDLAPGTLTAVKPDVVMEIPSVVVIPTAPTENPFNFSGQCYVDLNMFCENRGIPAPEYEEVKDEGPPHCKTFGVLCRVRPVNRKPIEVTGESGQKKKAKRLAAAMMLEKLQDFTTEKNNLLNSAEIVSPQANEPRISCGNKFRCAGTFSHAHHRYRKMVGPTMLSLCDRDMAGIQRDSSEATDILASIAEDEKLLIIYSPLPERGSNGLCQSFCEINYLGESNGKTSVFMGEGDDETNAQRAAAMNALIFLKEVVTA